MTVKVEKCIPPSTKEKLVAWLSQGSTLIRKDPIDQTQFTIQGEINGGTVTKLDSILFPHRRETPTDITPENPTYKFEIREIPDQINPNFSVQAIYTVSYVREQH